MPTIPTQKIPTKIDKNKVDTPNVPFIIDIISIPTAEIAKMLLNKMVFHCFSSPRIERIDPIKMKLDIISPKTIPAHQGKSESFDRILPMVNHKNGTIAVNPLIAKCIFFFCSSISSFSALTLASALRLVSSASFVL